MVAENCNLCMLCITVTGCPAITLGAEAIEIDAAVCYGCGLCAATCNRDAILVRGRRGGRPMKGYDIYLVGVGGQGVLTIGEIIMSAAFRKGQSVNFYPTKGMAQRGGFVKAQLRLGRESAGREHPGEGRRPGHLHRGLGDAQGGALHQAGRRRRAVRLRLGADGCDAGQGALSRARSGRRAGRRGGSAASP